MASISLAKSSVVNFFRNNIIMQIIRVILVIILTYVPLVFICVILEEIFPGSYYITAISDLSAAIAMLFISGYYIDKYLHKQFTDYINYDKSKLKLFLYSFILAGLMFCVLWAADRALSHIFDDSYYKTMLLEEIKNIDTIGEYAIYFVLLSFGAAIAEEIFFKGFCYTYLREKYNIYISIIISTLIFFAFHPLPDYIITSIVYSVTTCLIYEKTKSLLPTMFINFLYNAICSFEILIYYK